MEEINNYFNFKQTYKDFYIKNSNFNFENSSDEDLYIEIFNDVGIIFNILKISQNKVGYCYWRDAVLISIIYDKEHLSICNDIYPMIAKKYGKTAVSVERAMRLCFENALYNSAKASVNFVTEFLGHYLIYPRNSELLLKLVELVSSSKFQKLKYNLAG